MLGLGISVPEAATLNKGVGLPARALTINGAPIVIGGFFIVIGG